MHAKPSIPGRVYQPYAGIPVQITMLETPSRIIPRLQNQILAWIAKRSATSSRAIGKTTKHTLLAAAT